ncbi:hypothetical protein, partial [Xanthomonas vesicatoria]|uniref:hypothetical protein n=1 Tax=Xanthomonas vesicatoria TaxID=56460 RepID=UPI001F33B6A9
VPAEEMGEDVMAIPGDGMSDSSQTLCQSQAFDFNGRRQGIVANMKRVAQHATPMKHGNFDA